MYCGFENHVVPGMWAGGIVGVKSILGVKSRNKAVEALDRLRSLHYISYELNGENKKLVYQVTDWVAKCSGAACMKQGAVYATQGYGFLCIPRNITERLASPIIYAYFSLYRNCKNNNDCQRVNVTGTSGDRGIRGPCIHLDSMRNRFPYEAAD